MARSSAIFLALALFGATDAHAFRWMPWQRQQQPTKAQKMMRTAQQEQEQQETMKRLQKSEDRSRKAQSATNLRLSRPATQQRVESPFVRPSRAAVTWDTRGLGLTAHVSSISAPRSIYQRLNAAPVSIRLQLHLGEQSHGDFATRIMHSSELERGKLQLAAVAASDRTREYRSLAPRTTMFAFKKN